MCLDGDVIVNKKVLFFGNPPFGRNSSLALKFIKKCCIHGDTIAFILPKGLSALDKTKFFLAGI